MTKEEVKALKDVKKAILAVPERLVMGIVLRSGLKAGERVGYVRPSWNNGNPYEADDLVPECGTVGCIMGWVQKLNPKLGSSFVGDLVDVSSWPTDLADKYAVAKTAKQRAKLAGQAIDRWIKGDGSWLASKK